MKTGNKIALFYSAITIGVIAVVTLVFYWVSTSYISRLYYSYLTEKAYATAQKHWEKDETDDESYARIQQRYEETLIDFLVNNKRSAFALFLPKE